jgi:cytochrome c oxidase cbb3-type subunit 2
MIRSAPVTLVLGVATGIWLLWPAPPAPAVPPVQEEEGEAPLPPSLELTDWIMPPQAVRGRKVYEALCVGCHGPEGLGNGIAASDLNPVPRDFQKGNYKFRSTPYGHLPTREDLMRTVACGLSGSSMPEFRLVSELKRADVVEYILQLSLFGAARRDADFLRESEGLSKEQILAKIASVRKDPENEEAQDLPNLPRRVTQLRRPEVVSVPPEPEQTDESRAVGRQRYERECALCHGKSGRGDGGSSFTLRTWNGADVLPRDFSSGIFRSGSTDRDIYMRLKTGISGTGMGETRGEPEELWAIVHHIRTLIRPDARPSKHGCATTEDSR